MTIVFNRNWELFVPDSGHRPVDLASLGRAVRRMREQRGVSAEELAAATGMARQRIDALETGRLDPTYELLVALTEALQTRPSALVGLAEQLSEALARIDPPA